MNRLILLLSLIFMATGCNTESTVNLSDPLMTGRGFIESSLQGDFVKAEKYVLPDSTNIQYLNTLVEFNKNRSKEERESYREASIIVDSIVDRSDTTTIMYYHNSYKKEPSKIKMVKTGTGWLVDFKYSFSEIDSLP